MGTLIYVIYINYNFCCPCIFASLNLNLLTESYLIISSLKLHACDTFSTVLKFLQHSVSGLSHVYLLLQDLEKTGNEDKIKILHLLGHILSSNSEMKDEFFKLGGVPIISKYLDEDDWRLAGNAFHILGFCILQNNENKMHLTTECMFKIMLKNLEQGTINHKKGSMLLIASIVEGSVPGQILVRESGCLYELLRLFFEIIQQTKKEEDQPQSLYFLCTAIKVCLHNPQSCENQHQTSLIIPKALTFLDSLFRQAFNRYLTECVETLVPMLVSIIIYNPTNQLCFSAYSGIQTLVTGLNTLESWKEAALNIETVKVKLVCLLDAAICGNIINSEQATLLGVVPLLLKMLQNIKDQHKFSLLVALIHLVENSPKSKEEFLQANGITAVVVATVGLKADSCIMVAANFLLKFCATSVLEGKYNVSEDRSQRNITHDEVGVNKGNKQTKEQLVTEELGFIDFRITKKENINNEAIEERSQRNINHNEFGIDKGNRRTKEQLVTEELGFVDFSFRKKENISDEAIEERPQRNVRHYEIGSDQNNNQQTEKQLINNSLQHYRIPLQKCHRLHEDTQLHTDQKEYSPLSMKIYPEQHHETCIPKTREDICICRTEKKQMKNSHQDCTLLPQDNCSSQENILSLDVSPQYTSEINEIHLNEVNDSVNTIQNPLIRSSNTRKPTSIYHSLPCSKMPHNACQKEINQQQYTCNAKEFHHSELNGTVSTMQIPSVHTPNTIKSSNTLYSVPCSKMSHNMCQKEFKCQQYTSNTKECHCRELNALANTFQIPVQHTPDVSKSSNAHYTHSFSEMSHNICHKKINQQEYTSKLKEIDTSEVSGSLKTVKNVPLHTPNVRKSSNAHYSCSCSFSHNICPKEINKQHHVPKIKKNHPNEADCSGNTFRIPMLHTLKTNNTHYAFNMKEFHPSEVGHPANTSQILSLHTPHISQPSNEHYSSHSDVCQKEEKQQTSKVLHCSTDSIPSIQQSVRSCLSHTIRTPMNMVKKYMKDIFHRNSRPQFSNTKKNKRGKDFKTPAHIAQDSTLQEHQDPQNPKFDQITYLMENTNNIRPQNESGILTPVINDKEMDVQIEQVQCTAPCSINSLIQKEPENELKKGVHIPLRTTVTPHSCNLPSHMKSSILHRHKKNLQAYSYPMLRYSKEELSNLVAGVNKYGLDFKAIRRAYHFHRKRTPKDLYLKWRSTFISSNKDLKMPESDQQISPEHETDC